MGPPSIFKVLDAAETGLTDSEAAVRLNKFGPNKLPQKPPATIWKIFVLQFSSPLIYVLAFAAAWNQKAQPSDIF